MNCPKCNGTGRYYTEEWAGVKIHPCSCEQSMQIRQAQEQKFNELCKRLGVSHEKR